MGITTLALPPLGCGLGGLDWSHVKLLIEEHLGLIVDLDILERLKSEAKVEGVGYQTLLNQKLRELVLGESTPNSYQDSIKEILERLK